MLVSVLCLAVGGRNFEGLGIPVLGFIFGLEGEVVRDVGETFSRSVTRSALLVGFVGVGEIAVGDDAFMPDSLIWS